MDGQEHAFTKAHQTNCSIFRRTHFFCSARFFCTCMEKGGDVNLKIECSLSGFHTRYCPL